MSGFLFNTIYGWIGTAGLVVAACAVVAWYFPPFRQAAISIAGVVITAAAIYAKGNRDEAKKWDNAIAKDVQKGQQARADAARDVDAGRVRGDEWDRDKSGVQPR